MTGVEIVGAAATAFAFGTIYRWVSDDGTTLPRVLAALYREAYSEARRAFGRTQAETTTPTGDGESEGER